MKAVQASKGINGWEQILWVLFGLCIILRIGFLDLIEFKGDEMYLFERTIENLRSFGSVLQTHSVRGINHPPLLVYLLTLPALLKPTPIFLSGTIALLNIGGIVLLYFFLKKFFSSNFALWTTVLFASAPWTIIFSRKIWQPDIVFPFFILFTWFLFSWKESYKPWKVWATFATFAMYLQTHLGTWFSIPGILIFFFFLRPKIQWRDIVVGVAFFLAVSFPYLLHHTQTHFESVLSFFQNTSEHAWNGWKVIGPNLHWSIVISTGLRFSYLLGDSGYLLLRSWVQVFEVAFLAFAIVSALCLVASPFLLHRPQKKDVSSFVIIYLLATFVSVHLLYLLMDIGFYPHYGVLVYPTISVVLSYVLFFGVAAHSKLSALLVKIFLLIVIGSHIAFSFSFVTFLRMKWETMNGDYGKPYTEALDEWNPRIESTLSTDDE